MWYNVVMAILEEVFDIAMERLIEDVDDVVRERSNRLRKSVALDIRKTRPRRIKLGYVPCVKCMCKVKLYSIRNVHGDNGLLLVCNSCRSGVVYPFELVACLLMNKGAGVRKKFKLGTDEKAT